MQFMLMQDKMDDMDCSQDQNVNTVHTIPTNNNFVPKTELDYLLLGCMLESQQITPTQNSPNTLRAFSMYQRQFENHKMKSAQTGFIRPNNNGSFGQSQPIFIGSNGGFQQPQKIPLQNYNGQSSNPQQMTPPKYVQQQRGSFGNSPPSTSEFTSFSPSTSPTNSYSPNSFSPSTSPTGEKSSLKKEKKKPKRPNKVKPQGCEWCKVNSSPVWRGGPSGKGSLCNACGLQYMKGFTMERAKETLRKSRGQWNVHNGQLSLL